MIALLATYFVVAYLLIPGSLFSGFSSLFIPLKNFHRTRTQEVSFAVVAAALPFALALLCSWYAPVASRHPFYVEDSVEGRRADYRVVFSGAYSEEIFRRDPSTFWKATARVVRRQARFLFWYYIFVLAEAGVFALLIRRYGEWKRNKSYLWFADNFVLRGVSEWPMLFEEFTSPRLPRIEVWVDILTQQDVLYRGRLGDYFLDSDGALTGILLDDPDRFDRQAYVEAVKNREFTKEEKDQFKAKYWRKIPSADLYIPFTQVQNVNVRRELAVLAAGTTQLLQEENIPLQVEEVAPAIQGPDGSDTSQSSSWTE